MRNSSSGHASVIEWLLISLAPKSQRHLVTARDRDGETALHVALSREGRPVPTSTDVGITSETCPVISQLYDKARNEGVREPHAMALAAFLIVKGTQTYFWRSKMSRIFYIRPVSVGLDSQIWYLI